MAHLCRKCLIIVGVWCFLDNTAIGDDFSKQFGGACHAHCIAATMSEFQTRHFRAARAMSVSLRIPLSPLRSDAHHMRRSKHISEMTKASMMPMTTGRYMLVVQWYIIFE